MYAIAQLCGILSTVITVCQPQFRTKRQLSLCSGVINLLNGLNFALLGQRGASLLLCLVAVVQAGASVFRETTGKASPPWEAVIFGGLYVGAGLLGLVATGGSLLSLECLPIVGALMLMLSIHAASEQKTRLYLLLNSLCWLVYTAMLGSTVFFSCLASMSSAAVALWNNRNKTSRPSK